MGRTSRIPGALLRVPQGNYSPYVTTASERQRRRLKYPEDASKGERRQEGGRTRMWMKELRASKRRRRCGTANPRRRDQKTDVAEYRQGDRLETTKRESDICRSRPRTRRSMAEPALEYLNLKQNI
ncbi:hypothetical protein NDU88_002362 [Pleurodeles waltl]|uniref:Uncharacterized protein n=1 Tax=Pleurodeles waltl TaxID=8319 RepID=A0AAV7TKB1_PLEWA|nr:hypothetical protein NDU88_002362 [Pleurodeles waltl]